MIKSTPKFNHFRRFLYIILSAVILAVPVSALTEAEREMFAQNDIIFYDPEGSTNDCSSFNYTSKPTGDQITWIGDSYSVGARSKIETKIPGVDFGSSPSNIFGSKSFFSDIDGDAQSSHRLGTNGDINTYNPAGLTILNHLKTNGALREYVVFALGTNDQVTEAIFMGYIDELHAITGNNYTVVLVTPRTLSVSYSDVVAAIKQSAQKYSNIIVADWEGAVQNNLSEYFDASDPIHPNNQGYTLWVDTIYNALPGGVGMLSGHNNRERIWNYFAQANIPGVSDNPAVIAGIIGNMMREALTTVDPFVGGGQFWNGSTDSGFFGIFQTRLHSGNRGGTKTLAEELTSAGIDHMQYWHGWGEPSKNPPEDVNNRALQVQLDYLINNYWAWPQFMDTLTQVDNNSGEAGAASYSDLFLKQVEVAFTTDSAQVNHLIDSRVKAISSPYTYWQGASYRRDYATQTFKEFAGASVSTSTFSGGVAQWNDGWLVDNSIPGMVKEDAANYTLAETPQNAYTGGKNPDKILLHYTAGTQTHLPYAYGGNMFPPHFTINLREKKGEQHFSIWKPSLASYRDTAGQIQIEIVGCDCEFATYSSGTVDFRAKGLYFPDFTNEEWDYLAVLLIAIAEQTGIPLATSVDWTSSNMVMSHDSQEFLDYKGIIGHMHMQADKIDPGNIWPQVSAAIARNPDGAKFARGGGGNRCGPNDNLVSGGMTLAQAQEFMKTYRSVKEEDYDKYNIPDVDCSGGRLANCVSFTKYFINKYTTKKVDSLAHGGGVVAALISQYGFINGGTTPKPYAIFSTASGSTECGDGKPCGHTGVVLGIDATRGKIIIGEAGCGQSLDWAQAREKDLSVFTGGAYTYAYTDDILNLSGN